MSTVALAVALSVAQTPATPGSPRPSCYVVENARVFDGKGFVSGIAVVIEGPTIAAVNPLAVVTAGCERIDATGKVLTPGLVDPFTRIGLVEIELEKASEDATSDPLDGPTSIRAAFAAFEAYNPRSTVIPVTRLEGVTSALVVPAGGLVPGRSAFVRLAGATQAEAVRLPVAALHATLGGGDHSRAARIDALRALFEEAREYERLRPKWLEGRARPFASRPRDLEAVLPVLAGKLPLVVEANRQSDLEALLRLRSDWPALRIVVAGGAEAWLVRADLAKAGIPVVVDPLLDAPEGFDQMHARRDQAALLEEAGVPLLLSTFTAHNVRTLRQVAGNAVREGLPKDAALRALTRTPALVFGASDQGVVEAGARADLVLWSGDPLETTTHVERLWIGGREVPLESRQTKLRDRYRVLPGTPPPPLALP